MVITEPFVGMTRALGHHLQVPSQQIFAPRLSIFTTWDGKSGFNVKPILGGFFVEFRGEGTQQWHEIDGYDPVSKKFFWNTYGSDGGFQMVTYTIDGTTAAYAGTEVDGGKQHKIRGTVVFTPDFMNMVEKRERSVDGKEWTFAFESKAKKVKSSPK